MSAVSYDLPNLPENISLFSKSQKGHGGPPEDHEGLILLVVVTVLIIIPYIIAKLCL